MDIRRSLILHEESRSALSSPGYHHLCPQRGGTNGSSCSSPNTGELILPPSCKSSPSSLSSPSPTHSPQHHPLGTNHHANNINNNNSSEDIWDLDSQSVKTYSSTDSQCPQSGGDQPRQGQGSSSFYNSNNGSPFQLQASEVSALYNNNAYYDASSEWVQIPAPSSSGEAPILGGGMGSHSLHHHHIHHHHGPPHHQGGHLEPHSHQQSLKRPKSYQCEHCDKWFTSSGHLKRHYNTTLHRNALRKGYSSSSTPRGVSPPLPGEVSAPESHPSSSSSISFSTTIHSSVQASSSSSSGSDAPSSNSPCSRESNSSPYGPLYYYGPGGPNTNHSIQQNNNLYNLQHVTQHQILHFQPPPHHIPPGGGGGDCETGGGDYRCSECNKTFNKLSYLKQHNKSFHNGEKPYKCSQCGKRFPVDILYQEHLAKHAGDKPYKCEVCPKQFNHKTDLRRHMCLHTGEKPFSCEVCGKGFIREDRMIKHSETHKKKALSGASSLL